MMLLPQTLLSDLEQVPGFDESSFIAAHQQPAITSVRLHPVKQSTAFAENEKVPWHEYGRYLPERPVFTLDPFYHAGAYYVQEASSMFLGHVLRSAVGEPNNLRVLDLCAAPGGKSTLLASFLDEDSLLISNEVIRTRASILEENVTRWGYTNNWVTSNDPAAFGKLAGYFDVIAVDAPCSGSGLFRKDEKALHEWSEANVQLCHARQLRILADVWPSLKDDGVLIYATCSYSPQEDEQVLDWMAEELNVETITIPLQSEWNVVATTSPKHALNGYRFFPGKVKGEGFFIAALRKKESTASIRTPKFKSQHDKKILQQAAHLLKTKDWAIVKSPDGYSAINAAHEADLQILQQALYFRKVGLPMGSPAVKEWLPAHEIALSIDAAHDLPTISVNKEQALHFLKKEDINLAPSQKGWFVVAYEGLGLGWIKSLGNRANNYLPKHWRIRMNIEDMDGA